MRVSGFKSSLSGLDVCTPTSRLLPRLFAQKKQMAATIASGPIPPSTAPTIALVLGLVGTEMLPPAEPTAVGSEVDIFKLSVRMGDCR